MACVKMKDIVDRLWNQISGLCWLDDCSGLSSLIMWPYCWCTFPSEHSPKDTPFEDGTFKLTMQFTEEYPNKPPTVRFVSKMFHPNGETCRLPVIHVCLSFKLLFLSSSSHTVYADGSICLDILQNRWSPTYDVSSILTSIQVRQIQIIVSHS